MTVPRVTQDKPETYTLSWFLNGVALQGSTGPVVLARCVGADFNWRRFDADAARFLYAHGDCHNASAARPDRLPLTTFNRTTKPVCAVPPPADAAPQPAAALNGQPAFGRASSVLYIADVAVTGLAWPLVLGLNGSRPWQKRGRLVLACAKVAAALASVAATAMLVAGMTWVASATAPRGAASTSLGSQASASALPGTAGLLSLAGNATGTTTSLVPVIAAGPTASSLMWLSTMAQLAACVLYSGSCLLLAQQQRRRRQRHRRRHSACLSGDGRPAQRPMRQRPRSLPVHRPRQRTDDGEDDGEDLPPYQRDDPLGRPPSIPGYTISNGCTVAFPSVVTGPDCIPLTRVGSHDADASDEALAPGRQSPRPDYEEVEPVSPVSPVSLLAGGDGATPRHGPGTAERGHAGDQDPGEA